MEVRYERQKNSKPTGKGAGKQNDAGGKSVTAEV